MRVRNLVLHSEGRTQTENFENEVLKKTLGPKMEEVRENGENCLMNIFMAYVYWAVHHLYSCVKRKNQLDATYFII